MKLLLLYVLASHAATAVLAVACSAEHRINVMRYITAAFNENNLLLSAAAIQGMPLQDDAPAFVSVNGVPAVQFGFDAASTKDFAQVVRQAFSNVVSEYTDFDNGTTLMEADVTLGVLGAIDFPISAQVPVPAQFNLTSCMLKELRANVRVPSKIGGNPLDTPTLEFIPGLDKLPGAREVLKALLASDDEDLVA
ncbi:uncharacterized protein RCC_07521 [Ramularia collo-cygni]|uniref:Uncharacterized protein n=1 Tax=Ramularia collo-cygni TaxID=112498 RepID=A0A2D3VD07_9PEZI|nr:uncharacterized protein RCC_07521 [Ramularia collo-cygni]CZT21656.1 uncharacterized protein RCC_07521 [Ramularia collo-cygni]